MLNGNAVLTAQDELGDLRSKASSRGSRPWLEPVLWQMKYLVSGSVNKSKTAN